MSLLLKMLNMAWPAVVENLLNSATFFVDALMVASLGPEALAAVGLVGVILWRLNMVLGCTRSVGWAIIARRWGEGRPHAASRMFTHNALLTLVAGAPLWLLLPVIDGIMAIFFQPGLALKYATTYAFVLLLALPFHMAAITMASGLKAVGDTVTPMLAALTMNVLNIALNYLLIFGKFGAPELGILGAAIASAVAHLFEFVVLGIVAWRGLTPRAVFGVVAQEQPDEGHIAFESIAPERVTRARVARPGHQLRLAADGARLWLGEETRRLLRIAHPTFWEQVAISIGFYGMMYMMTRFGPVAVAANTASLRLESFSFNIGHGIGVAVCTLVGQALGRGDVALARRGIWLGFVLAASAMGLMGILYSLFPANLTAIFVGREDVGLHALAMVVLLISAMEQPLIGMALVLTEGLKGSGTTVPPFQAQMIGTIGVRLGVGYVLAFPMGLGVEGIIWATLLDWLFRTLYLSHAVLRRHWTTSKV
jgi:Na+-driven multidrug efflux pump